MYSEMNIYRIGAKSQLYSSKYEDFVFQKSTSKNMDKLCHYFHFTENYPEFYLGLAKQIAICKCPGTGKKERHNIKYCRIIDLPVQGEMITVQVQIKDKIFTKDFIFMGWERTPIHEWRMKTGLILQLEQKFIDGLSRQDKRYLRMYN